MTAAALADLLHARKVGRDKWIALCPHHGDKTPSLSISVGRTQPVVMTCRSHGCSPKDILAALGLTWRDLMRPQAMTPELKADLSRLQAVRLAETRWKALVMLPYMDPQNAAYWHAEERVAWNKMMWLQGGRHANRKWKRSS